MTITDSSVSASSPDGRQFRLDLGGVDGYAAGDFVTIAEDSGDRHLGLVEWLDQHAEGGGVATGSILERLAGASAARPFTSAAATHSDPEVLAAFYRDASAVLGLGSMVSAPDVQVGLVPKRLNRHTFWCGQSGSGKTFALGVALEQILMHTRLPVLVLDPNGDFVRLGETRQGADETERTALAGRDIRVLRPGDGPDGLRIRFRDMSIRSKGAIFRLDPLVDHEAFNVLVRLGSADERLGPEEVMRTLRYADDAGSRIVASRLENLGVTDWTLLGAGQAGGHRRHRRTSRCDRARHRRLHLPGRAAPVAPRRLRGPLATPRGAPADPHRGRRGAQPLLARPGVHCGERGARADHPDRRRGPEVRALAAPVHSAPVQGPPETRVPVRQPDA